MMNTIPKTIKPELIPAKILIGYARVSTEDQDCAAQVIALRAAGCTEIVTEQGSGANRQRPALNRLLASLRPGETLVVVRLDRLARSVLHLVELAEQLDQRGIGLRSLSDPIDTRSPAGRFALHVLAAVAELERALIIERTKAGLVAAAARGKRAGNPGLQTDRAATAAALGQARSKAALGRAARELAEWMPVIEAERPATPWRHIAETISHAGGPNWSGERLRRTWLKLKQEKR